MSNRRRRAGFTLVELMVALIAGAFAVSAVYYLNGVGSRAFSQQMMVSETQMSLRGAMDQIKRDFARAGYLGVPSTTATPDCFGANSGSTAISPRRVQAMHVRHDGSTRFGPTKGEVVSLLGSPAINRTRADDVLLWGNFATADAYLSDTTRSSGSIIYLQENREAFRRSFYAPAPANGVATFDDKAFSRVFAQGNMVRVEHGDRYFFRDIQSSNASDRSITLTDVPPCYDPTGWVAVAPIQRVHYAIESDGSADFARLKSTSPVPGSRRTMLVRREENTNTAIDLDTSTTIAGAARLVLDHAVEFSVDAIVNTNPNARTLPVWGNAFHADVETASLNNPERLRSAIVTLTARLPEADPRLPSVNASEARPAPFGVANQLNAPMMLFRVIDLQKADLPLYARVRTLRSEILLQNL